MSGHSHWSTIQRHKGIEDSKRGATFTKVANNITLAAKLGGSGNPDDNPRLRTSLEEAKTVNMPKENIQRAIDRGLGKLPGQTIEEILYEGFGPGHVAFIIEGITDNKLRTHAEIKNLFERSGGSLASSGAVSYMFESKGEIKVKGKGGDFEEEMLELIDFGAEDVADYLEENVQYYLVYTQPTKLGEVSTKITQAGYGVEKAELVLNPTVITEITDKELAEKVLEFAGKLENNDDVQKVYANFSVADGLV